MGREDRFREDRFTWNEGDLVEFLEPANSKPVGTRIHEDGNASEAEVAFEEAPANDSKVRLLDVNFFAALKGGFLAPLLEEVSSDRDLLLEIRHGYINVYYKGHSLLKLTQHGKVYSVTVHANLQPTELQTTLQVQSDTREFVIKALPEIKRRISRLDQGGNEIEFEQMLIRANNSEPKLNSEYYFIDRQIASFGDARFDLTGIFWDRRGRRKGQSVPMVVCEVKFGQNPDIKSLDQQIERYYERLPDSFDRIARNAELLLRQKIDLGLLCLPPPRLEALRTLKVSPKRDDVRFAIALIDYNPASQLLQRDRVQQLSERLGIDIDIFYLGFGLWDARAGTESFLGRSKGHR